MENLIELEQDELMNIEGEILPLLAVGALIKGIGIGFAAGMAIYGAYEIGKNM